MEPLNASTLIPLLTDSIADRLLRDYIMDQNQPMA